MPPIRMDLIVDLNFLLSNMREHKIWFLWVELYFNDNVKHMSEVLQCSIEFSLSSTILPSFVVHLHEHIWG